MKTLLINGSIRPDGNTATLIRELNSRSQPSEFGNNRACGYRKE